MAQLLQSAVEDVALRLTVQPQAARECATLERVTNLPSSPLERWWAHAEDASRERVLALQPRDPLPEDLALSMQLQGVRVIAVGVVWSETNGEWIGQYEQPDEVVALLASISGDDPG